jgi:hypothetical protein
MPEPSSEPLPPTTTLQQDLTVQGQRKVNLIWEYTQAIIAITVVLANLVVGVSQGLRKDKSDFPAMLSNCLFLVVGFYFSRTNHTAIGGIGRKPEQPYEGR